MKLKKFKLIGLLLSIILFSIIKSYGAENNYINKALSPPKYSDSDISRMLDVNIEKNVDKKQNYTKKDIIKLPKKKTSKKKVINSTNKLVKEKQDEIKKEDNKIEENTSNQYIKFRADNGRIYYLINLIDNKGNKTTKLYTEMNDEKLQLLASGKSQSQIDKENQLKYEEEELKKQKEELEKLKNAKPEKKKSKSGTYILIGLAIAGVVLFKKMKSTQPNNKDDFDEDDEFEMDFDDYKENREDEDSDYYNLGEDNEYKDDEVEEEND
ncbi:hypothetical protein LV469_01350 [Peptoniphilus sp. GNH]|nr:hypothetical protein LV469_01350 [Peptoniphilus sp. GNH]